jgi:uncharacterized protein (DUF1015 family)
MAEIRPFRALRFDTGVAGAIEELLCPPYDIISEEERQEYLRVNEHNVVRLELPRGERPYEEAGALLERWMAEGVLRRDGQDGIYVYEEEFEAYGEKKRVKGLICRVKLEEFDKGVVLPHEETLSKAKEDRLNLMKATNCNFSQIYSLYMDEEQTTRRRVEEISAGVPLVETTDAAGVTHRLWVCTDPAVIAALQADFAARKLYIADGHHRYETALNYRNWRKAQGLPVGAADSVMMMLVDMAHEGLVVFPTHRLVHGLEGFDAERMFAGCAQYFSVSECEGIHTISQALGAQYAQGNKAFACYTGGDSYRLLVLQKPEVLRELLPKASDAVRGLDVTVLHTLVLERLLGIDKENMARQQNLTYTRSMEEALEQVRAGNAQCAFLLNPTRVTEIRDVAAAGEKMPQKSTYFYPKLITGLVMNALDE